MSEISGNLPQYFTIRPPGKCSYIISSPEPHFGKSVTIRQSNHASGVYKEHYV